MSIVLFDLEADGLLDTATQLWCANCLELDEDFNQIAERTFTPDDVYLLPDYLNYFDVVIGHNIIQYDFRVIKKITGVEIKPEQVIDTLLMSRTQRPNRRPPMGCKSGPHSVDAWGMRLGQHKPAHEDWSQFSAAMLHRCVSDSYIQLKLLYALLEEGQGEGWDNAHKLISKMYQYLQKQEEYGFYVDQDWMEHCLYLLDRWLGRIDTAVTPRLPLVVDVLETKKDGEYNFVRKPFKKDGSYAAVVEKFLERDGGDSIGLNGSPSDCRIDHAYVSGCRAVCSGDIGGPFSRVYFRPVDLDKAIEVKNFLLEQGWQPAAWNTDKDGNRTSPKLNKDDPFDGLDSGIGKLAAKRIQCKQRRGVIQGLKEAIRPDGRIGAGVNGIAATGRLKHNTIVNIPGSDAFFGKHMRKIFSTAPGKVLVGVDSKGNQMRQLVSRLKEIDGKGDESFTHAVLYGDKDRGTDLHELNRRRSGVGSRTLAKNFFYGCILFGAGDPKTAKILKTTKQKAKALKAEYFKEMPLLRSLLDEKAREWRASAQSYWDKNWGRMVYRNGYIKGLDGRPILVESEHSLLAYILQSDEAIQMAVAYVMTHKWMEEAGYVWGEQWGMCIWMHDEFQMECDPDIAQAAADIMCRSIKWAGEFLRIQCPHDGDAVIGENWAQTH